MVKNKQTKLQIGEAHASRAQVVAHEQSRDVVAVVDVLPRLRARVPFVGLRAAADLAAAEEVVGELEAEAPSRTVQKPRYGATMRAKVAACVEINKCVGCTR